MGTIFYIVFKMSIKKPGLLAFSVLITQLVGTAGSIFTMGSLNNWYPNLVKPSFNPPDYLFGPVWIILYTLMGLSLYFVLLKNDKDPRVRFGVILYFVHLSLNSVWTFIFFGLQQPMWAFYEIAILFVVILFLMIYYFRIDTRATFVLFPYLLWVGFATYLNYQIWILNS